ncbi:MAG TPA: endonuclease/exonuclease/phosphatase family protein [Acidimicrobiales bacterium]
MLRALSFNIHHGVGLDGRLDLGRVAAVVEAARVDIAGLQEVDRHYGRRSRFVDQPAWLADRLGWQAAYGAAIDADPKTPGAPRRQYGNLILSRHPIGEWRTTPLPRPEGGEPRALLEAVVATPDGPVRLFATQLQNRSTRERQAQVAAVRARVAEVGEPVVLVGDLNALPDSPELAALTEDLVDAWARVGRGAGHTYDAASPHGRIDYVLTSPDVEARAAAVLASDASDHLPLVADLALPAVPAR